MIPVSDRQTDIQTDGIYNS